jgi:hypothetical protein
MPEWERGSRDHKVIVEFRAYRSYDMVFGTHRLRSLRREHRRVAMFVMGHHIASLEGSC